MPTPDLRALIALGCGRHADEAVDAEQLAPGVDDANQAKHAEAIHRSGSLTVAHQVGVALKGVDSVVHDLAIDIALRETQKRGVAQSACWRPVDHVRSCGMSRFIYPGSDGRSV